MNLSTRAFSFLPNTERLIWLLSLLIICVTAWFSNGYFHADEHYQIIEFAGYKLGWNQANDLAWEFGDQIRPSLQPWIAAMVIGLGKTLGIQNPYILAFLLRLVMGVAVLCSLRFFYKKTSPSLLSRSSAPQWVKLAYVFLLCLSWFVPFLSVRFSSETASAAALLVGLALLFQQTPKPSHSFFIGIWFGIAFFLRFQVAFGLIGLILWALIFKQYKQLHLIRIFAGFLVILVCNVLLDSLFYNTFVFTPWNYFEATKILDGGSNMFDESSVVYFLEQAFFMPTTLVGSIVLLSLVFNLIFNYRSPILWFFILFIAGHLLIPHKEERFLFPLVFLFPYFILFMCVRIQQFRLQSKVLRFIPLIPVLIHLVILIVSFPALSLESAGLGRTAIMEYVHTHYRDQPITFIHPWYADPYNPWGLRKKFYLEKEFNDIRLENVGMLTDSLIQGKQNAMVCVSEYNLLVDGYQERLKELGFHQVCRSVSEYKYHLNRYTKAIEKGSILYLYTPLKTP